MIDVTVETDLRGVEKLLRRALKEGADAMADSIHEEADERVPQDTGALKRSGRVEKVRDPEGESRAIAYGDQKAPYAASVHERLTKGRGYLRDAVMGAARKHKAAAAKAMKKVIERGDSK